MPGKVTIDAVFILRHIQEEYIAKQSFDDLLNFMLHVHYYVLVKNMHNRVQKFITVCVLMDF